MMMRKQQIQPRFIFKNPTMSPLIYLSCNGYNDLVFKNNTKKVSRKSVTVQHSTERIEKIQLATTNGNLFHATGGGNLTDDDIFLATQKKFVESQIQEL